MKLQCTCLYCDHKWITDGFALKYRCPSCGDKNIDKKDVSSKVDYYEGSPAFEKDTKKEELESQEEVDDYFHQLYFPNTD